VLTVCGTGPDLQSARAAAYQGVAAIDWKDAMFRTDIGLRALRAAGA
jgi:phosphoribosylamine--glycine ligase